MYRSVNGQLRGRDEEQIEADHSPKNRAFYWAGPERYIGYLRANFFIIIFQYLS